MNSAAGDMANYRQTLLARPQWTMEARQGRKKRAGFGELALEANPGAFHPILPVHTFSD